MMDAINLSAIIEVVTQFGTLGVLVVVWWTDRKELRSQYIERDKGLSERRKEFSMLLERYKSDMNELRAMYQNNVSLVKDYASVAGDLKEVVIMNTQAMTQLCLDVQTNQYCPNVRLEKQAKGVQG